MITKQHYAFFTGSGEHVLNSLEISEAVAEQLAKELACAHCDVIEWFSVFSETRVACPEVVS